jgi:hypothetical protein
MWPMRSLIRVRRSRDTEQRGLNRLTFSPATLKALVAVVTGGPGTVVGPPPVGIYRKAPEIERLMAGCGLDFRVGSLSRMSALADFLRALFAEPDGVAKVERVILRASEADDYLDEEGVQEKVVVYLNRYLTRDGRQIVLHGDRPH